MNVDKARKNLDIVAKTVSILGLIAMGFAIWFSIRFAKSKTKIEMDNRQVYFNDIHANFNKEWGQNAYWDSGKIEVTRYKANYILNDKEHPFDYKLVINKEDFNDQYNTKTNSYDRPDIYEVIKVNASSVILQNDSLYNSLTSMYFLRMNVLVLHKMTHSSQDPNGSIFKHYFNTKNIIDMHYNSYRDQEGIGQKVFKKDVFFEDQLMYTLRALQFKEGLAFKADVLEAQNTNKVGKLLVYTASFTVSEDTTLQEIPCWLVKVNFDNTKNNLYYFEKDFPNRMLRMESRDEERNILKTLFIP